MTQLVLALRGAAAVAILTTLVGGLPRVVQLGLAVAFGLWAMLVASPPPPPDGLIWLVAVRELAIGATLGIVAAVPLLAAAMAGKLVDVAQQSRGEGPYAALFGVLAAAVFVGIDGHVTFATAIAESYGAAPSIGETQPRVMTALAGLIGAGVKLAVPWLVTAVVVELARGVGVRIGGRAAQHAPAAIAVPAAIAMMTAALIATLAVAIAAAIRGTL
jgi:flagellar biosynthesis protein FliR